MLPHRFRYHRPRALEDALELLQRFGEDASPYAGGTELLLALKAREARFGHLVDLKRIPELATVERRDDAIVIGAMATHFTLAAHPLVRRHLPAYAKLSDNVANIRIRVAGTIGGNLCFARRNADPPALLCAMDASVTLAGPTGTRAVAVADFIAGEFATVRKPGEIMTAVAVPVPAADARFAYCGFSPGERTAVGVAAGSLPDGRYRVWAGAIAGRPIHLAAVEDALAGVPPDRFGDVMPAAARVAANELPADDDLQGSADYKRHLAAVLMRRALEDATGFAPHQEGMHGDL